MARARSAVLFVIPGWKQGVSIGQGVTGRLVSQKCAQLTAQEPDARKPQVDADGIFRGHPECPRWKSREASAGGAFFFFYFFLGGGAPKTGKADEIREAWE